MLNVKIKRANEMRSEILSALENFVEETQHFYILKTLNLELEHAVSKTNHTC